jgi:hypothetical protein
VFEGQVFISIGIFEKSCWAFVLEDMANIEEHIFGTPDDIPER